MKINAHNDDLRYPAAAIFLHWIIAIMVVTNLLSGFLFANNIIIFSAQINFHKLSGVTILSLVVVRVLWRLTHSYPSLNGLIPTSERFLAHFGHLFLYFLLLVLPLSGILLVQSFGKSIELFGLAIPQIINTTDNATAEQFLQIHEALAIMLSTLVTGHIIAALKHHFIDKNDILRRMLPKWFLRK